MRIKKILLGFVALSFALFAYSGQTSEYCLYWGLKGNIKKITSETRKISVDGKIKEDFVSVRENEYDRSGKSLSETLYSLYKGKKRVFASYTFKYDDGGNLVAKIMLDENGSPIPDRVIYVEESESQRKFTSTTGKKIDFITIEKKENGRIVSSSLVDVKSGEIKGTDIYKFDENGNKIGWASLSKDAGCDFEIKERDARGNPTKVYINKARDGGSIVVYYYEYYK